MQVVDLRKTYQALRYRSIIATDTISYIDKLELTPPTLLLLLVMLALVYGTMSCRSCHTVQLIPARILV